MSDHEPVEPITYDRSRVSVGIVHFGVGNFHRSHQAMYIDRLLRRGDGAGWGICGVGVLPGDRTMRDALASQEHEYTLVERRPDGSTPARRIGSIVDYLYAPEQLEAVLELLAAPTTRIVSLTITEGGYNISDDDGSFDTSTPAIVADAAPGALPSTVLGIVVAGLRRRRERGIAPFTVMSCDNIQGNGDVARGAFTAFAAMADAELAEWLASEVSFPNSMVDRITPVTSDADREWVAERFGIADAWPVLCEDFVQWVLEDDFPLGRPDLEAVGVQLVDDVRPYELMKLRLLNASHQAMAYYGILRGWTFAHEAATDPVIVALLRSYMDGEATPTLEPVPGVDLDAYKAQLIERFANPYVRDTLARLATDASDRIPKFLLPVVRDARAATRSTPLSAAVVASWARYAELWAGGTPVPFSDRQESAVRDAVEREAVARGGFLQNSDWFGGLGRDDGFVADYLSALDAARSSDRPEPPRPSPLPV